ncbi:MULTISPECIES: ClpP family protease [Salinimicrobium]|uniref:ClpP family protease n=1 Tax=Salinimicrobium TaxID=561367 RepID=UPI001E3920FA|nr:MULTISPECIES: ATP-dependent Clp protease proteolytic subunit [Salinimicrobium]MCC8358307.1 ATP-dependent Clp protease proteolytic subunit [Salinimicrobium sediminilitoris]MCY2688423.1 ATP-dependent Clp protease proteolytic subunit [Salinimicrobium sp. TH3]
MKDTDKTGKIQDQIERSLLNDRKIFIWGTVNEKTAKHVIERMMYLDATGNEEIQFYISSPGGYVTAGFAIYDTMLSLNSPVSTICTGLAASMASILLSAGAKGRRFVQPHAKVMIHQPSGGAQGQASNIEIQAAEILKIKEQSARILAENCGQSYERVYKDFNRDYWMDASESVEYGIVDEILQKK